MGCKCFKTDVSKLNNAWVLRIKNGRVSMSITGLPCMFNIKKIAKKINLFFNTIADFKHADIIRQIKSYRVVKHDRVLSCTKDKLYDVFLKMMKFGKKQVLTRMFFY